MSTYRGIPFNGGMNAPTGTGAQHIVETCKAIIDFLEGCVTPGVLADAAGHPVLDWRNRQMNTDGGVRTVDWENAALYTYLDGSLVIDWGNRHLVDTAGINAIEWGSRTLKNSSGDGVISFVNGLGFFGVAEATAQPGAAETASDTYGLVEQQMLQTVYDMARAYGLLT